MINDPEVVRPRRLFAVEAKFIIISEAVGNSMKERASALRFPGGK